MKHATWKILLDLAIEAIYAVARYLKFRKRPL
jgi:hypothetical protein